MTFQEDWDARSAYIELALQKSGGAYSIDDVREYVVNGDAHFEPVEEGGAIFFFHQYPNKKVLRIWLSGGTLKSDLTPVLECAVREADLNVTQSRWKVAKAGNEFYDLTDFNINAQY